MTQVGDLTRRFESLSFVSFHVEMAQSVWGTLQCKVRTKATRRFSMPLDFTETRTRFHSLFSTPFIFPLKKRLVQREVKKIYTYKLQILMYEYTIVRLERYSLDHFS